ncbi:MAG: ECF transporter S component [Methanobacteriota archaeon]|nr:MAG: ECF transporter S component [Euryarchaeota archaeon]
MASGSSGEQGGKEPTGGAGFVSPKTVALYGVLTALTAAITFVTFVPFAPTKGYFNMGDSMVFFSAFAFGWRAGAICGGVGSAAADVLLGSGYFAPYTLVAKGSEGLVAGLIDRSGNGKRWIRIIAISVGGACMVATYFLSELYLLDVGWGAAIAEVPGNIIQVIVGGTVGSLLAWYVRKAYPTRSRA